MTDSSGTTADEQSNRISALAALYRAEQSTLIPRTARHCSQWVWC